MLEAIKRGLVEEAEADVVGLWAVLWDVRQTMPFLTSIEARRATLDIVREALGEAQVVAGHFADRDDDTAVFVPWHLSTEEIVARIEREWVSLGREPSAGDIAWFVGPRRLSTTPPPPATH